MTAPVPLREAFPPSLTQDVEAVTAIMPTSWLSPTALSADVPGNAVSIPYRIYHEEPPVEAEKALSRTQRAVLDCLYSRHHNGRVRQRCVEKRPGRAAETVLRIASTYTEQHEGPGGGECGRFENWAAPSQTSTGHGGGGVRVTRTAVIDAVDDPRPAVNGLGPPTPAGTVWAAVRQRKEVRPMKAVSMWVLPLFVTVGD